MSNPIQHSSLLSIEQAIREIVRQELFAALIELKQQPFGKGRILEELESVPSIRFGWNCDLSLLEFLHYNLKLFGFFDCEYSSFEQVFIGHSNNVKIKWNCQTSLLAYVFSKLQILQFIPLNTNIYEVIHSCFIDKKGNAPSISVLKSSLSQVTKKCSMNVDQFFEKFKAERQKNNIV